MEERKDTFDSNISINREPGFTKVPINLPLPTLKIE